MLEKIRACIMERPWLYRAIRTFFQAFLGTLAGQFVVVSEKELDEKLLLSAVVSSLSAGISAVMNTGKGGKEEKNGC